MNKLPILCVDDDPQVLASLAVLLGRFYEVHTETDAEVALRWVESHRDLPVIVSDLRMPGMDGIAFLAQARIVAPDSGRVLLTGFGDYESAIAAVNEGHVFRFLTKPTRPETLFGAVNAAAEHHHLITAERVLLTETLQGAVQALTEVLSITSPRAFGRASRLRDTAARVAVRLGMEHRWPLEMAAMLSPIGFITLPAETLDAFHDGRVLSEEARRQLENAPRVTARLLAHVPRLDDVCTILESYWPPRRPDSTFLALPADLARQAQVLRAAVAFDIHESRGNSPADALAAMRSHSYDFDGVVLDALAAIFPERRHLSVTDVPIGDLSPGMIFHRDVRLRNGTVFVARGYTVTPTFVERIRNLPAGLVVEPLAVIVPDPPSIEDAA